MIYAMSDIHGRFDKYSAMLREINFGENDTLYVLGDIIDRYDDGLKILIDLINRPNVRIIMGNHEALMLDTLNAFDTESIVTPAAIEMMMLWIENGGEPTLTAYLDDEAAWDRHAVVKAPEDMPLYAEVEVSGNKFVLAHGGLENFSPERPLESYSRSEIVWARPEPERGYFEDKLLIVGHTPTELLFGEHKIFRKGNFIDIDCGIAFESDKLGCLRLDDLREYYV